MIHEVGVDHTIRRVAIERSAVRGWILNSRFVTWAGPGSCTGATVVEVPGALGSTRHLRGPRVQCWAYAALVRRRERVLEQQPAVVNQPVRGTYNDRDHQLSTGMRILEAVVSGQVQVRERQRRQGRCQGRDSNGGDAISRNVERAYTRMVLASIDKG